MVGRQVARLRRIQIADRRCGLCFARGGGSPQPGFSRERVAGNTTPGEQRQAVAELRGGMALFRGGTIGLGGRSEIGLAGRAAFGHRAFKELCRRNVVAGDTMQQILRLLRAGPFPVREQRHRQPKLPA